MSYNSFNVIYVVICFDYLEECTGKTDVDKTRLRDRVKVYRQHIKQPEHQQLKVEEHIYEFVKMLFLKYSRFFRCDQMTQI